jgi:5-methylcytosine-specific restriction endonuclease McrA
LKKPVSDFYKQKMNSKDGYQSHCKVCDNARKAAWEIANPEKAKQHQKIASANKYLNDKELILAKNKSWKQRNPAKVAAMDAKRRTSVLQRTPKWLTPSELLRIECMYSLASMLNKHGVESWHVDHIIPLQGKQVSGLHVYSNLRVVPSSENLAKGNRYDLI